MIQRATLLAMGFLLLGQAATADTALPVDLTFAGYMRSGTGDNDKGGKQVCFNNPGSVANEFRLGNECGTYGEASFRVEMLKPKTEADPFFRSQLTFAYFPPNDSQYEDTAVAGNHDINVVEAYVEGMTGTCPI
jgi:maltoporin